MRSGCRVGARPANNYSAIGTVLGHHARRHDRSLRRLLAVALGGGAILIFGAGPVWADSPGPRAQKYIDLLTSKGLGCSTSVPCKTTGTGQDLLELGHMICAALRSGRSELGLIDYPPGGVTLDRYHAGLLVGISEAAFCPGISAPPAQPA
ncbi:DUF732 domain-containing protein [Mycolicibacterium sp. 120266]|uniref:DUF732 domain-containing protein n=1 Tax=Mycolicibacterium sp. 120266 TaxID=3090601 RepID=UPI00299E46FE|nr:DUF732 domain-containing protein [Mycolicibacterium sp. 120266]MDX1875194.1 DUF732 domain-containing protein [Mycolicibacterium sp. 120266]